MISNKTNTLYALTYLIFGFGLIFSLSGFIENNRLSLPKNQEDSSLILQGAKIKDFSLGMNGLLADFYWIQSLQYVGEKLMANSSERMDIEDLSPLKPHLLYPLLENAGNLDPQFKDIYLYGAIVLPAINKDQAIKLVKKGIENNPDEWRLYQHLGYIYWKLGDYEKASESYAEGAKIFGAPPFMKMMTAKMKSDGGSRDTAREIYRQLHAESEDTQIKENARLRLLSIESLEERDVIRKVLQNFKQKNNRCAENWREIHLLLQNEKLPEGRRFRIDTLGNIIDPTDAPYLLDKENCDVNLDVKKTKLF